MPSVIEVVSGEYGDLSQVLIEAVQSGLCEEVPRETIIPLSFPGSDCVSDCSTKTIIIKEKETASGHTDTVSRSDKNIISLFMAEKKLYIKTVQVSLDDNMKRFKLFQ